MGTDADGSIAEYRWDLDGDDTIDNVTTDPATAHAHDSQGGRTMILPVEDGEGATDRVFRSAFSTDCLRSLAPSWPRLLISSLGVPCSGFRDIVERDGVLWHL